MKKLERLSWIERTFGKTFVLPYRACFTVHDLHLAISIFEMGKKTWGMRTDTRNGSTQGFNLPFLFHGTPEKAAEIWDAHREKLVYIVSENVPKVKLHAVAQKLDHEHVLFEFNDRESEISQRDMYKHPENVRRIALGPNRFVLPWGSLFVRCFDPAEASFYRFDKIYDVLIHSDQDEATFSVREDGRIVVW